MRSTTIRTVEPFDWRKLLITWWPDIMERQEGNRVYYTLKPGTAPHWARPPHSTSLTAGPWSPMRSRSSSSSSGREIRPCPHSPISADWKRVERDLVAVVLDDHDGRLSRATRKTIETAEPDSFLEFIEGTDHWVFGLADADDFLFRAVAACRDPRIVGPLTRRAENLRQTTIVDLEKVDPKKALEVYGSARIAELARQVLGGLRISSRKTSVEIEPGPGGQARGPVAADREEWFVSCSADEAVAVRPEMPPRRGSGEFMALFVGVSWTQGSRPGLSRRRPYGPGIHACPPWAQGSRLS